MTTFVHPNFRCTPFERVAQTAQWARRRLTANTVGRFCCCRGSTCTRGAPSSPCRSSPTGGTPRKIEQWTGPARAGAAAGLKLKHDDAPTIAQPPQQNELPPVDALQPLTMHQRGGGAGGQFPQTVSPLALGTPSGTVATARFNQQREPGPNQGSNWLPAPKSEQRVAPLCAETGGSGGLMEPTSYQVAGARAPR